MSFKVFTIINIFYITQVYCAFYNLQDNLNTLKLDYLAHHSLEEEFNVLENIKTISDSDKESLLSFINPEINALSKDVITCVVLQKIYNILNYQTINIECTLSPSLKTIVEQGLKTRLKEKKDIAFFKKTVTILQKYSANFLLLQSGETLTDKALKIEALDNNAFKVLLFMMLIAKGFNINSIVNSEEQTILMIILKNRTEIIIYDLFLLFLSNNLYLYHEDITHYPLAYYFYDNNYHEYVKILIDNGLNINHVYSNNMVLLDHLTFKIYEIIFNTYNKHNNAKKRLQELLNTTFHLDIRFLNELVRSGSRTTVAIADLNDRILQPENAFLNDRPCLLKRLMLTINPNLE